MTDFQPEKNLQLLQALQIDAVPVLVAPENGGYRILRSESAIVSYLQANCTEAAESPAPAPETRMPGTTFLPDDLESLLPPAQDEECRVDVECTDPLPPYFEQTAPIR